MFSNEFDLNLNLLNSNLANSLYGFMTGIIIFYILLVFLCANFIKDIKNNLQPIMMISDT